MIPFATIDNYILALRNGNLAVGDFVVNIFGNLLAFAPFALFLPRLFKKTEKSFYYFFVVFAEVVYFSELERRLPVLKREFE